MAAITPALRPAKNTATGFTSRIIKLRATLVKPAILGSQLYLLTLHQLCHCDKYYEQKSGDLQKARLTDDIIQDAIQFAEDISAGIENADYETKRQNLELLQVKVIIKGRRFIVNSLLGEWEGEIRDLTRKKKGTIATLTL